MLINADDISLPSDAHRGLVLPFAAKAVVEEWDTVARLRSIPDCHRHSKRAIGKLGFAQRIVPAVLGHRFPVLPITGEHVEQAAELPPHHADPSDRLLIAQAYLERMLLGTQDTKIRPYGVTLLGLAAPEKPLPRDLIDIRGRIAELAEHRVSMLAEAGWGQAEALAGCARKRNRNSHRQHFPFRGVLDAPEKAGLGEIGLREQA